MEYASNGKGNLGVTLGAIGTGASALPLITNMLGGGGNNYVNKETFDVQLQLINAQKDNAILAADLSSEKKMVEVFNASLNKTNAVRDELIAEIRTLEHKFDDNVAAQAVLNAQMGSQLGINTSQIAQLFSLTQLKIPNTSVCPGWGNVTVTPTITPTTTT